MFDQRQPRHRRARGRKLFVPERTRRRQHFGAERHDGTEVAAAAGIRGVDHVDAAPLGQQQDVAGNERQRLVCSAHLLAAFQQDRELRLRNLYRTGAMLAARGDAGVALGAPAAGQSGHLGQHCGGRWQHAGHDTWAPNRRPTPAAAAIANAPQNITRIAPRTGGAPRPGPPPRRSGTDRARCWQWSSMRPCRPARAGRSAPAVLLRR